MSSHEFAFEQLNGPQKLKRSNLSALPSKSVTYAPVWPYDAHRYRGNIARFRLFEYLLEKSHHMWVNPLSEQDWLGHSPTGSHVSV